MSQQDDGGTAFPGQEPIEQFDEDHGRYVTTYYPVGGMSLRDYFAGQALVGIYAGRPDGPLQPCLDANFAYVVADAMLAERVK